MKLKLYLKLFALSALWAGTSCVTNKEYILLQGAVEYELDTTKVKNELFVLEQGDHVDIKVKFLVPNHPLKPLFEDEGGNNNMQQMMQGGSADLYFLTGYRVNENGIVKVPYFGDISAEGLNVEEFETALQKRVNEMTSNVYVTVRYSGIRFSVLGEVNRQGRFSVMQDRMNIFDAVSMAGGFRTIANKQEVVIVREYPEGRRTHIVSLLEAEVVNSPFYYLEPNDVVFVPALEKRIYGAGTEGLTVFLSVMTVVTNLALIISLFAQ